MHRDGPVTQLSINAAPRKWTGLRVLFILMLSASIMCATALASPGAENKTAANQAKAGAPGDYVGGEVCATCHEDVAKGFAGNPHTRMAAEHGTAGVNCEGCHGPGKAHVEGGGDKTKIFNPSQASAKDVDKTCLGCHDIHGSKQESLLKAPQPALCFQCHTDVKPQFDMPTHHKVNEGLIKCSDCHDVHGTFEKSNLRSRNDSNLICTKCHTEKRGPFVYEHTPVKGEGCMGCHTPHGSQNARLLNMPNINVLCNQCHSPVAAGTVHGINAGSSELTPCTDCHTMIHGSNINVAFLR